jgi:pyrroline-5-carboxylate reductase
METIVFAGAGSMAEAMIGGIVDRGAMQPGDVFIMNRSDEDRLDLLKDKYGVSIVCEERNALKKADLVILAMKPKDVHDGMASILPYLKKDTAILSVIAGVSIGTIEKGLGARPIARSMPNTSATIGKSASAVTWNNAIDDRLKKLVLNLLTSIGLVIEVEEDELHAVTALSGSGPAYVYYMAEALEEAAIGKGLSREIARALIIQTLEGAAAMLRETGTGPSELRRNVTSPGGTTEAGVNALEDRLFKEVIAECVGKAESRSRELGALS